jgi:hypothetical protein
MWRPPAQRCAGVRFNINGQTLPNFREVQNSNDQVSATQLKNSCSSTTNDSSAVSSDGYTVETCSSTSTDDFANLGPPPPGSIMDYWDTKFSSSTFHDFTNLFIDGVVTVDDTVGAALVKWPKYFFLLITMKLASLVEIAMLIIYHQGTKKIFDRKVIVFCKTCRKVTI